MHAAWPLRPLALSHATPTLLPEDVKKKKKRSRESSGREIELACNISRQVRSAQLALKLFRRYGLETRPCAAEIDVPVDLVERPGRRRGGLRRRFRQFRGVRWIRECEKVRVIEGISGTDPSPGFVNYAFAEEVQGVRAGRREEVAEGRPWELSDGNVVR